MSRQDSHHNEMDEDASAAGGQAVCVRQLIDAFVCLSLAVVLFRAFQVEGYMISTGSMAPALFGYHKRVVCPSCRFSFALGDSIAEQSAEKLNGTEAADGTLARSGTVTAVCPNCSQASIDVTNVPRNQGDQLLVHKHAFLLHRPRRWEVAVFRNPFQPAQAYVKRIVGLPGESIQVIDGDVFIDGAIQRKGLVSQRAARILVYDTDFRPAAADPTWQPRWTPEPAPVPWTVADNRFDLDDDRQDATGGDNWDIAWVQYRHWVRSENPGQHPQLEPVTDVYGYNRRGNAANIHTVRDLMLAANVTIRRGRGKFVVQMNDGEQTFQCVINTAQASVQLLDDSARIVVRQAPLEIEEFGDGQPILLEMSLIDRQVLVAIDGRLPFKPWPMSGLGRSTSPPTAPVRFGARGLTVTVSSPKLYRDVYYTRGKAFNGVENSYQLGSDEFFMLGDNSPVSLDSRSWPDGAVSGRLFIGKPFLVHLPSRPGKIRLGNRNAYFRIPDFSRIRYIR